MPATRKPRSVITFDLPEPMIDWINAKAAELNLSRSAYLRILVHRAMTSAIEVV
jgi:hypothetical protein